MDRYEPTYDIGMDLVRLNLVVIVVTEAIERCMRVCVCGTKITEKFIFSNLLSNRTGSTYINNACRKLQKSYGNTIIIPIDSN